MKNLVYKKYIDIPSSSDKIAIGDITNKQFNIVSKTVNQGDEFSISESLETLIEAIVIDNKRISTLSRIDKAIIVLSAYKDSVNDKITINTDEGSTQIYVQQIIDNILNIEDGIEKKIKIDNIEITLASPKKLYYSNTADLIVGCIDRVLCEEDVYFFSEFTEEDKDKFLDSITHPILNDCQHFLEGIASWPKTNVMPVTKSNIEEYNVSLVDNSIYFLIKSLFNVSYYSISENIYMFISQLNGSIDHYNEITPFDFEDYVRIHQAFQKRQQTDLNSGEQGINNF